MKNIRVIKFIFGVALLCFLISCLTYVTVSRYQIEVAPISILQVDGGRTPVKELPYIGDATHSIYYEPTRKGLAQAILSTAEPPIIDIYYDPLWDAVLVFTEGNGTLDYWKGLPVEELERCIAPMASYALMVEDIYFSQNMPVPCYAFLEVNNYVLIGVTSSGHYIFEASD